MLINKFDFDNEYKLEQIYKQITIAVRILVD